MKARFRLVTSLSILVLVLPVASRGSSLKQELRFGVEAAQSGLWREAVFRWEKYLKERPDEARVRNNLAVAYEGLGQFERAREQYEEALRLDPKSKEIRKNYTQFQEMQELLAARSAAPGSTDE
jgi:Flp pilus assembly protein TadD